MLSLAWLPTPRAPLAARAPQRTPAFEGLEAAGGLAGGRCFCLAGNAALLLYARRRGRRRLIARAAAESVKTRPQVDGGGISLPLASCVKIWAVGASPNYRLPWQVEEQQEWTGSAFAVMVGGLWRLLTNAHVVDGALRLRVSQQSRSRKVEARVLAVAHDLDLALLAVDDDAFRDTVPPVDFVDGLPPLFLEVEAIGYPQGGTTICVTKGVVSRVDAQLYAHPAQRGIQSWAYNCPGKLLIVQIDAAINAGNSGGPAIDRQGRVLGVASSGMDDAQNVGYIIPSCLVLNFLDEVLKTGCWGGTSDPGFKCRTLENDSLREFLQIQEGCTGVQFTSVAPLGVLVTQVSPGDVLLRIDGQDISNEGTVLLQLPSGQEVQLDYEYLITSKRKGDTTSLTVLRHGGEELELTVTFAPISPLVPRFHGFDAAPSYFVVGGYVFTRLSTPLLLDLALPYSMYARLRQWKEEEEEVVILIQVLQHAVNEGVEADRVRMLHSINGERIRTLDALVRSVMATVAADEEDFLRFVFHRSGTEPGGLADTEVLRVDEVLDADDDILSENMIPAPVSSDLAAAYKAHAPADVPCVKDWLQALKAR